MGWFTKIREGLGRAREALAPLLGLGAAKRPLDDDFWNEFEERLLNADFGVPTTMKILAALHEAAKRELWTTSDQAIERFRHDVTRFMTLPQADLQHVGSPPRVVLVVGVNGTGKTTSVGKLAYRLRRDRQSVMVVAADTFRAAAAEQLAVWAERSDAAFIRGADGSDPASVVYDAVTSARARGIETVIVDTAGRLHTKKNLMEELKKIRKVIERELGRPPDETLLVLDATTGQNAITQARLFHEATPLTGLILTKLDSTAKGGVVVAVVDTVEIPIKFVGLGEALDAFALFDPTAFVAALFEPVVSPSP